MISQRAGDGANPAEVQFRKWTAKGTMKSREAIIYQLKLRFSHYSKHGSNALSDESFDFSC